MKKHLFNRIKTWLQSLSFRTGVIVLLCCIPFYILSFAQMLLPISAAAKGVLWTILFGLAKTCQYGGLTILGVEGYNRLKNWIKLRKSDQWLGNSIWPINDWQINGWNKCILSQMSAKLHTKPQKRRKTKPAGFSRFLALFAEREGFEPPEPLSSTVFKTAAIDHSAISPSVLRHTFFRKAVQSYECFLNLQTFWSFFF